MQNVILVTPSDYRLLKYWTVGPGSAKIMWNVPGDFDRCVAAITEATKGRLGENEIKGLCSNLHVKATGARPGHAAGEQAARAAEGKP